MAASVKNPMKLESGLGTTAKVVPASSGRKEFSETKDFKLALLGNVDSGMVILLFYVHELLFSSMNFLILIHDFLNLVDY